MPKKDVYASIGTILIFGFILLLLLWLKLVVPAHLPEKQSFAGTGQADEQDVAFGQFHIAAQVVILVA